MPQKDTIKEVVDQGFFVKNPEVQECLARLRQKFSGANALMVSDTLDGYGNQYVNLVQKGGGVLGVALVGYTYILEEMGIRFLRLAGTSAGAINTALMTVVGNKEEAKSGRIIDIMCELDFFALVDGHPAARWLIKKLIKHEDFALTLWKRFLALFGLVALLLIGDFVLLGLERSYPGLSPATQICFVLTGFAVLLLGSVLFYIQRLILRLKNAGFGINPGDYFYDWIKKQFIAHGVTTVSDLIKKAAQPIYGLHVRKDHPDYDQGTEGLEGDVTFITSELVTENKIQFPKMCCLFREKADIDTLQPAGFVRASMAIPLFFESYFINNIPIESKEIEQAWLDIFGEKKPPASARFVDGGLLSNFPINLFFNPQINVPRLPTFAINLDESAAEVHSGDTSVWSLFGYFGRMLKTLRGFYDKDFLIQHKAYEKGIGSIELSGFNWLNFFLENEDKKKMFIKGAQAATDFLMEFNWEEYKHSQATMRKDLKYR